MNLEGTIEVADAIAYGFRHIGSRFVGARLQDKQQVWVYSEPESEEAYVYRRENDVLHFDYKFNVTTGTKKKKSKQFDLPF